jgi:hypothetical protein
MPSFTPGSDREKLGFAGAVASSFAFLVADHGFRVVSEVSTLVRFESETVAVQVFHGRGSYELGVELHLAADGAHYSLREVIALDDDPAAVGYRSF